MSRLGAAVHVITTTGPGGKTGFTATAVVLGVGRAADAAGLPQPRAARPMPILRENGVFCVNTLRAGDDEIADMFAGRTGVHAAATASTPANGRRCRPARRC